LQYFALNILKKDGSKDENEENINKKEKNELIERIKFYTDYCVEVEKKLEFAEVSKNKLFIQFFYHFISFYHMFFLRLIIKSYY
jgi:hypothetical protein